MHQYPVKGGDRGCCRTPPEQHHHRNLPRGQSLALLQNITPPPPRLHAIGNVQIVSIPAVLRDRYTPLSNRAAMYGDTPSAGRTATGIPGLSSFSSR